MILKTKNTSHHYNHMNQLTYFQSYFIFKFNLLSYFWYFTCLINTLLNSFQLESSCYEYLSLSLTERSKLLKQSYFPSITSLTRHLTNPVRMRYSQILNYLNT